MKRGWKVARLANVLELQNGYAFDSKWFNPNEGLPLIRIRSLKAGVETDTYFNGIYDSKYIVNAGDLLVGMDGEFGCYEWKGKQGLLNQRVCRLQGFSAELIPKFLYYGLNDYLKAIEEVTGYTTVKHISSKQILEIEFPVPPLAEQQRIVSLLDEAFEGIATAKANAERNLQNARALFECHLQSVFSQRGPEWMETTLEEVLDIQPQNGWSPPAANHSISGTPVLTLSSVTGFQFRPDKRKFTSAATDSRRNYWVKNGDLLITRSNTPELVGHVAIAHGITEPTIYPDLIMRMNPAPDRMVTEFLYFQMRTTMLRKEIMGRAQGANPTMKKISNSSVKTLPVMVPSIATQMAIVETMNELTKEIQRLTQIYQQKVSALDELKKALLHKAFAGEL